MKKKVKKKKKISKIKKTKIISKKSAKQNIQQTKYF